MRGQKMALKEHSLSSPTRPSWQLKMPFWQRVVQKGRTVIRNAAIEPEIIDLILFLQKLGAIVRVDVDRTIYIQEMTACFPVEHTVITDRTEAACFGMAAISTKGRVFVEGSKAGPYDHLFKQAPRT